MYKLTHRGIRTPQKAHKEVSPLINLKNDCFSMGYGLPPPFLLGVDNMMIPGCKLRQS